MAQTEWEVAFNEMFKALKAVEVSLIEDEYYQHFKPLLKTVKDALNKAEGVK